VCQVDKRNNWDFSTISITNLYIPKETLYIRIVCRDKHLFSPIKSSEKLIGHTPLGTSEIISDVFANHFEFSRDISNSFLQRDSRHQMSYPDFWGMMIGTFSTESCQTNGTYFLKEDRLLRNIKAKRFALKREKTYCVQILPEPQTIPIDFTN
jgi:hypothetical protein